MSNKPTLKYGFSTPTNENGVKQRSHIETAAEKGAHRPTLNEIKRDIWAKYGRAGTMDDFLADEDIQQQLTQLIADIIGEDLPTDMYGSWTMNDGAKRRILLSDEVIITNKTHATQRQKAKSRGIDL